MTDDAHRTSPAAHPPTDREAVRDIGAELAQCLDNLETVLAQAGADLSYVVRLNYSTTDVDALSGVWNLITERLAERGCRPAGTLLGVARLAFPDMLVEIEATALVP